MPPSTSILNHNDDQPTTTRKQRLQRSFMIAFIIVFSFLLCLLASAPAHEVWIEETSDGKVMVRFAEYGDDYEKSPGYLDGLYPVVAWTPGEKGPNLIDAVKKEDGYLLTDATTKQPLLVEAPYAVMKRGKGPARKPLFYARWHTPSLGAAKPALNYDIVPTGNGSEVQVHLRGKPLPEAKLTVVAPDGKEEEITANAEGKVTFDAAKPGNYLIYGKHQREEFPGLSVGVAYDTISHNCSLFWKQP